MSSGRRIEGFYIARSFALVGMVMVNFKIVMVGLWLSWLRKNGSVCSSFVANCLRLAIRRVFGRGCIFPVRGGRPR